MGVGCRALVVACRARSSSGSAQHGPQRRARRHGREKASRAVLVDVVVRDRRGQPVKRSDAGRLRDPRRRRGADDRIVHADPRRRAGEHAAPAAAPAAPAGNAAAPASAPAIAARSRRHRDCLPRPQPRGPQARGGGGAGLPRTEGRDAELRRHLRNRPLAGAPAFPSPATAMRSARRSIAWRRGAAPGSMLRKCSSSAPTPRMQRRQPPPPPTARPARRAPETAAMSAPPPATPSWRRWKPAWCRGFQAMERNQQGYIATNALVAIVRTLGRCPAGRAWSSSPRDWRFRPTSRGCSSASSTRPTAPTSASTRSTPPACAPRASRQKIRDMVIGAGGASEGGYAAERRRRLATDEGCSKPTRTRCGIRTTGLRQLAIETGGQCSSTTPTTSSQVRARRQRPAQLLHARLHADQHGFDGKFRTIQVKVKRSGLTVAARKGYFAVRNPGTSPVNDVGSPRAWRTRTEAGAERVSRSARARCSSPNAAGRGWCPWSLK